MPSRLGRVHVVPTSYDALGREGPEGRRSLLNRFAASFRADTTPTWTDHSFDCEMCIHIAREVMLMESQGLRVDQIQAAIEGQYSHGHVRTPTPMASHETGGRM